MNQERSKPTILITGASRGLGRALALELASPTRSLALVGRNAAALASVVAEAATRDGRALAVVADVAEARGIHRIAGEVLAQLGRVDVLVHNASELGPTPLRLLGDTDCEDFERVLQANVLGPFRLTKALLGGMALRRTGLLVHVSSDAAVEAYPTWGAYSVSKAASDHLSRLWAAELEAFGIRSIAIDPGEMDTAMHAAAVPDADRASLADPADVARVIGAAIRDSSSLRSGGRYTVRDGQLQEVRR